MNQTGDTLAGCKGKNNILTMLGSHSLGVLEELLEKAVGSLYLSASQETSTSPWMTDTA